MAGKEVRWADKSHSMACNSLAHLMRAGDVGGEEECSGAARRRQERSEFDEPDYALIDTLFSLAEAHLFMQARAACRAGPRPRCLAQRRPRASRRLHAYSGCGHLQRRFWLTPAARACATAAPRSG